MTPVTCRLTANNRDQLQNPTLINRVWATFTFQCGVCVCRLKVNAVLLSTLFAWFQPGPEYDSIRNGALFLHDLIYCQFVSWH